MEQNTESKAANAGAQAAAKKRIGRKGKAGTKKPVSGRRSAKTAAKPAAKGSRRTQVEALIGRERGATLAELTKATGWQAHSVRGFLSILGSKGGLKIKSTKQKGGQRTYQIK